MSIRKTKAWRSSIIFYQGRCRLTHALSGLHERFAARFSRRNPSGKIIGQTIIKNYIDKRKGTGALNVPQLLSVLKSARIQKELENAANQAIDTRLKAEYSYFRSKPSLAFHMTREITRRLICYNPPRIPAYTGKDAQARLFQGNEQHGEQREKTKIVREEFVLTPQLLQIISDKVASGIFRSIELERLRSGL